MPAKHPELSREPLVIGSDYSRHPMPGQMGMDLAAAGERNSFEPTTGCRRWGHWYGPDGHCNRCSYPSSAE